MTCIKDPENVSAILDLHCFTSYLHHIVLWWLSEEPCHAVGAGTSKEHLQDPSAPWIFETLLCCSGFPPSVSDTCLILKTEKDFSFFSFYFFFIAEVKRGVVSQQRGAEFLPTTQGGMSKALPSPSAAGTLWEKPAKPFLPKQQQQQKWLLL